MNVINHDKVQVNSEYRSKEGKGGQRLKHMQKTPYKPNGNNKHDQTNFTKPNFLNPDQFGLQPSQIEPSFRMSMKFIHILKIREPS